MSDPGQNLCGHNGQEPAIHKGVVSTGGLWAQLVQEAATHKGGRHRGREHQDAPQNQGLAVTAAQQRGRHDRAENLADTVTGRQQPHCARSLQMVPIAKVNELTPMNVAPNNPAATSATAVPPNRAGKAMPTA